MTAVAELATADLLDDTRTRAADLDEIRLLCGWTGTDEELQFAWEDFTTLCRERDSLDDKPGAIFAEWCEMYDAEDLGIGDRQAEAIQRKAQDADDARNYLLTGSRGI